jgi:hypothetical protein
MNGVSTGGTPVPIAAVGVVAYDGSGNIAGPGGLPGYYTDQSVGGTYSPVSYANGTYATDSLGRVTVNLQGAPSQPVWYLVGSGTAYAVGTDATVMSGDSRQRLLRRTELPRFLPGRDDYAGAADGDQ